MPSFTRRAIKESFWKLLNERPLHQITVKDIVEDCGINRNSFYYHFQDMPALVEDILEEMVEGILRKPPVPTTLEEGLEKILRFLLQNKRAVYHIYHSMDHRILENHLLEVCRCTVAAYIDSTPDGKNLHEKARERIIRYHQCECFGQIIEWLNHGMQEDLLSQIPLFCAMSKGVTTGLLQYLADNPDA